MFETFGDDHLAALLALLLLAFLIWLGRHLTEQKRKRMGKALGFLLLGYGVTIYIKDALEGSLSWDYSLPLHLCHLVLIACIISLFRPTAITGELAYFWGLGGTVQAVLTPDLAEGFPSWEFIQFFWSHGGILLAIAYFILAEKFRPRPRSVLRMFVATNLYALVVGILNYAFGWNYGYLRQPPVQPSLLDYLGPWPWYILSLEGIALLSFWLLDLPWRLSRRPRPS